MDGGVIISSSPSHHSCILLLFQVEAAVINCEELSYSSSSRFSLIRFGLLWFWNSGNFCMWSTLHDTRINVWGCSNSHGLGKICKVDGILEKNQFHRILQNNLFHSAAESFPNRKWIFQQDNDPEHTYKTRMNVMSWPSQPPELISIGNIWAYLDRTMKEASKREQLFEVV